MAVQYDFLAGFDPSASTQVSGAQLLQMVNQITQLPNIGGVIVMSGAANAHPDVTNNPRFIRYIWLDTQTPNVVLMKIYQGTYPSDVYADWTTVTIANNSITAAQLANYAVSILNGSGAPKIAYKQNATADATKSNYILRLDANGQYVEVVAASTIVAGETININKLSTTGASDGYVLSYSASLGYAVWQAINIVATIPDGSLAYSKLVNGGLGYILRADPTTGVWAAITADDATNTIFTLRSLRLAVLSNAAAVDRDTIRFDGTNWVRKAPFYGAPTVGGLNPPDPTVGGSLYAPHGLGAKPRTIRALMECVTNDQGYTSAAGHQVDLINLLFYNGAAEITPGCTIWADATNVGAVFRDGPAGSEYQIHNLTTFARGLITLARWNVYFCAEL